MRRQAKQRRSRELVEAVLEATAQVLARDGRLSANAVARRAGVSPGSFYQYFRDAADAEQELVLHRWRLVLAEAQRLAGQRSTPLRQRAEAMVTAWQTHTAALPRRFDHRVERVRHALCRALTAGLVAAGWTPAAAASRVDQLTTSAELGRIELDQAFSARD